MIINAKMLLRSMYIAIALIIRSLLHSRSCKNKRILLYGWYGTETLGDKLILLGILKKLVVKRQPIVICSINPNYTKTTLNELTDLALEDDAKLIQKHVKVAPEQQLIFLREGDTLVFGGGPLMDDPRLLFWVMVNWLAKLRNCKRIIWGCGIGPLRIKICSSLVRILMKMQSSIVLRPSLNLEETIGPKQFEIALCPSFLCYSELREFSKEVHNQKAISVNLRYLPRSYVPKNCDPKRYSELYLVGMARLLSLRFQKGNLKFFSTHELDWKSDSEAAKQVCNELGILSECQTAISKVIKNIASSEIVIATRYHGFVLGLLLGKRTIGVDYTPLGGKLSALCHYLEAIDLSIPIENVINNTVELNLNSVKSLTITSAVSTSDIIYDRLLERL